MTVDLMRNQHKRRMPVWRAPGCVAVAALAAFGEMRFSGRSEACRWGSEREETSARVAGAQLLSDLEIVGPVVRITKSSGIAFARTLLAVVLMACGSTQQGTTPPETPEPMQASGAATASEGSLKHTPPELSPEAALKAALDGRLDFAAAFYQQVRSTQGNLFVSPLSVSEALEMTWLGARGETADAMATALKTGVTQDMAIATQKAIGAALEPKRFGADGTNYTLRRANRVWVDKGTTLKGGYVDDIREAFGAGPESVDFVGASDASRTAINAWVGEQTRDKISELLPAGSITSSTRLVLTNAVYFKAGWLNAFSKTTTKDAPFAIDGRAQVDVPTMTVVARLPFHQSDDMTVVTLAYEGAAAEMVIMLPEAGKLDAVEATLTSDRLSELMALPKTAGKVKLMMPKFEFRSKMSAANALRGLGMGQAFGDTADFSGMTDSGKELSISDVFHEAFIAVDEEGTEAAAATAVVMRTSAMMNPRPPTPIALDRPFIFVIRDRGTGTVMFMGRVSDPR